MLLLLKPGEVFHKGNVILQEMWHQSKKSIWFFLQGSNDRTGSLKFGVDSCIATGVTVVHPRSHEDCCRSHGKEFQWKLHSQEGKWLLEVATDFSLPSGSFGLFWTSLGMSEHSKMLERAQTQLETTLLPCCGACDVAWSTWWESLAGGSGGIHYEEVRRSGRYCCERELRTRIKIGGGLWQRSRRKCTTLGLQHGTFSWIWLTSIRSQQNWVPMLFSHFEQDAFYTLVLL